MSSRFPTTRFVFDRKHTASKKTYGLVQIEVLFERRRKFLSTGVKLFLDEWNERNHVVNRPDMIDLNKRIDSQKKRIDEYINGLITSGTRFDFAVFDRWLVADNEKKMSFIDWLADMIERRDTRQSTKRAERRLISCLLDFGRIVSFQELTKANIMRLDDFLHSRGLRQTTVYGYHKTLKTYIREAICRDLLDKNPYDGIKFDRGKSEWGRYLTIEELERLQASKMPTQSIERVRDLFFLQCLTGLAYADLMAFDYSRVHIYNGQYVYSASRAKTDIQFTTVLLPKALEVLKRYDYHLPTISNQQYNMRLKVVADAAGIEKPLASHFGRRTCGMVLLNEGFPIEVVAKVLGHANIKTTQEAYARILDKTVVNEFAKRNVSEP